MIAAAVFVVLLFTNEPDSGGGGDGNASPGAAIVREQLRTVPRK